MFQPPAIQSLTAIQTCLKTLLLVIFVIKDIQTIVTTAAQGHATALLINKLVIPTRGVLQVNKTCTETVIGVVNQVEALQETRWTKLMRTITTAASRPCNVRALSQSCVNLVHNLVNSPNRLLPVLEDHYRGLLLSHLNLRILMSMLAEPAERPHLFLGKYLKVLEADHQGSRSTLLCRRGRSRPDQLTRVAFPDLLHLLLLPGNIGAVLAVAV